MKKDHHGINISLSLQCWYPNGLHVRECIAGVCLLEIKGFFPQATTVQYQAMIIVMMPGV
jgi:hypothetical protein